MILALDIGTKRTGVALSFGQVARPFTTIENAAGLNEQVARICQEESVHLVVVGLPINEDGTRSAQAEWVELETEKLKEFLHLPVVFEDEFLTTVEARRMMADMGMSPSEMDQKVDQYAAQLILQQYIGSHEEIG